jgi:hypothetical protein
MTVRCLGLLLALGLGMRAFAAAEDLPPVPPAVLAEAAAASRPRPALPSAEAVAAADQVEVLLARADALLAVRDQVAAGERFMAAVALLEPLTKADRRALGARYHEQRQHLTLIANQLLLDPAIAAALGPAEPATPAVASPTP